MEAGRGAGRRQGGAILSRWPIVESINFSLLREEFSDLLLEALIVEPGGREWRIAGVHLHPRASLAAEERRMREIEAILEIYAPMRETGQAHLLAGDFNANSPVQRIVVEKCKPRTREEFAANGGMLPRECVSKLLGAGYVDTLQAVVGEAAGKLGSFTTRYPGQRLDYIFAFGVEAGRINGAKIEQDRLARYASDHFPVVVQVD
jgi:endonuclease/exonuclease/phosphatase family metal-dependent hydrolase